MTVHQHNRSSVSDAVDRGLSAYGSKVDNSMCDCTACEGRGGTGMLKCNNCKGTGKVENAAVCPTCKKKKVTGPYSEENCMCGKDY